MTKDDTNEVTSKILSQTASDSSAKQIKGSDARKNKNDIMSEYPDTVRHAEKANCCCKSDKTDVFFDKLLKYLEKQSELVANSVPDKKPSIGQRQRRQSSQCEGPSCSYSPEKAPDKKSDNKYQIYLDVFTCDKNKNDPNSVDSNMYNVDKRHRDNTEFAQHEGLDLIPEGTRLKEVSDDRANYHLCEKKVDVFFKLADDICDAYLKRSNSEKFKKDGSSPNSQFGLTAINPNDRPSYYLTGERYGAARTLPYEYQDKREDTNSSRQSPDTYYSATYPSYLNNRRSSRGSCLEMFEERYGKMLRELHSKLIKHNEAKQVSQSTGQPMGDTPTRSSMLGTNSQYYPHNIIAQPVLTPQYAFCCLHQTVHGTPMPPNCTPEPKQQAAPPNASSRCECKHNKKEGETPTYLEEMGSTCEDERPVQRSLKPNKQEQPVNQQVNEQPNEKKRPLWKKKR